MPASAVDVVRVAFQHTIQQLFKPFRLGQWIRLAFVGFLAGELGNAGGCSYQVPWLPQGSNEPDRFLAQAAIPANLLWFVVIPLLVVLGLVLFVTLMYVNSMMRFVLFDSVVNKRCHVRSFWRGRREPGFRYFVFQLFFALSMAGGIVLIAGSAAVLAFSFGWVRNWREHLLALILFGFVFLLMFASFIILAIIVAVLTKDFVVPQMALENLTVGEAWGRLWLMLQTEKAGYAGYLALKIGLAIAGGIAVAIAVITLAVVLLVPTAAVVLIAIFVGRSIGLVWNLYMLSASIVGGITVLGAVIFGALLISVPVIVFFPAYSIHFFAARYPVLNRVLYPSAPPNTTGG